MKLQRKNKTTPKPKERKKVQLFGVGKEKQYLAENLSSLVASGVSILDALHAIAEDIRNRAMKKVLLYIIEDIENGSPVWKAFDNSGLFNEHTLALIRIGEETGRLSDNLKVVADEEKKSREFKSKVRSAMMYPIFVLGITGVIGTGIAWFILPKLAAVFTQLNVPLPLITQIIISFGIFLQEHGAYAVPSIVVGIISILFILFGLKQTKFIGQYILFHIPGIRNLVRNIEVARFGFLFGTLLKVGIPISQAIEALQRVTSSRPYKKFYKHLSNKIQEGASFKASFSSYDGIEKILPLSVQQIIVSGEKSGNLADALLAIGDSAEKRTEDATKNLSVILEPVLLVVVWLAVLVVALGVLLPIYSLTGGLTGSGGPGGL